jgi:hypothetical protein
MRNSYQQFLNTYNIPDTTPLNVLEEAYVEWLWQNAPSDVEPSTVSIWIQDALDGMAHDGIFPEKFLLYYYDLQEKQLNEPEEIEIDHEFHFYEAPLSDDYEFNKQ